MPKKKDNETRASERLKTTKRRYSKPELVAFGDVRDFTMGGSVGVGESGNPGIRKPTREPGP